MSKPSKRDLNKNTIAYEQARRKKIEAAESSDGRPKNPLIDFSLFTKYDRNGLEIELSFTAPTDESWSAAVEKEIFEVAKANMQKLYDAAPGWSWGDAKKLAELRDPKARYVLARNKSEGKLVAFSAFRFLIEDDFDVLYLFELQLTPLVQGKGLGRFLMQLTELIARKNQMQW
jgi:GNAT superfamily N-acetyltransferase